MTMTRLGWSPLRRGRPVCAAGILKRAAILVSAAMALGCGGGATAGQGPRAPSAPAEVEGAPPECAGALLQRLQRSSEARGKHQIPSRGEWSRARRRLAEVRAALGRRTPHTRRLALKLREPFTGRLMEARGAVAIAPPSASLRMILLGPGGTTALDLWVKGDRFRFSVPALDLLRRGDAGTPREQTRGLPVDFLKWWLLRPAEGTLLWHERTERADHFVLRDSSAVINLCVADSGALLARRTTWVDSGGDPRDRRVADQETVIAAKPGCAPVRYVQALTGLEIAVTCEGEETDREPSPRAFEDPDNPGGDP
jgi:hypothetical protein